MPIGRMDQKLKKEISIESHDAINKEEWNNKFKNFLSEPTEDDLYDLGLIKVVAGEKGEEANKDRILIASSVSRFIELPDFPKEKKEQIRHSLSLLKMSDPHIESMKYYGEHDIQKKNNYADTYNRKMEGYISKFKEVIHLLSDFLPEKTINDLLTKAKKFSDPVMKIEAGEN